MSTTLNRTRRIEPDIAALRGALRYAPDTGLLTWRARSAACFSNVPPLSPERKARAFNARYAGRPALNQLHKGYRRGGFGGQQLYAYRVVFAIVAGFWPPEELDHINGDKSDNRISNLRLVGHGENMLNKPHYRSNSSGRIGVSFDQKVGRWRAYANAGGRRQYLGFFDEREDAVAARAHAEMSLNFHPNHGRLQSLARQEA